MLNEITRKDKYCAIPLMRGTQRGRIHRDRKERGGCQGRVPAAVEWCRLSVWEDENVPEMNGGDSCTKMCMYLTPLTMYLEMVKTVDFMLCAFRHKKARRSEEESHCRSHSSNH